MKEFLSQAGIEYRVQDMIKEPPSKDTLSWIVSQTSNSASELLNPFKVKNEDPYYVAHIKGQENTLTESDYIDIFYRFPDLLKKPILTDGSNVIIGFDEEKLVNTFGENKNGVPSTGNN